AHRPCAPPPPAGHWRQAPLPPPHKAATPDQGRPAPHRRSAARDAARTAGCRRIRPWRNPRPMLAYPHPWLPFSSESNSKFDPLPVRATFVSPFALRSRALLNTRGGRVSKGFTNGTHFVI